MTEDDLAALQGRLFAYELFLTNLAFRWGITQSHPPTAFAALLRPIEENAARMCADPQNHPLAMETMQATIRGMAEALEGGLHAAALRRPTSKNPGRA